MFTPFRKRSSICCSHSYSFCFCCKCHCHWVWTRSISTVICIICQCSCLKYTIICRRIPNISTFYITPPLTSIKLRHIITNSMPSRFWIINRICCGSESIILSIFTWMISLTTIILYTFCPTTMIFCKFMRTLYY